MKRFLKTCIASLGLTLVSLSAANATPVTFDLRDAVGTAGNAFEGGATSFIDSNVTLGIMVDTTLGDGTGSYSANADGGGINSDGITGALDGASDLDLGETLTFTFTFLPSEISALSLTSIDFSGVGSSGAGDAALVSIAGAPAITLETGAADFNGSTDVFSPAGGITLNSGDTIVFTAETQFDIATITVEATAVPEPASTAALSLLAVGGFARHRIRRRRKAAAQKA